MLFLVSAKINADIHLKSNLTSQKNILKIYYNSRQACVSVSKYYWVYRFSYWYGEGWDSQWLQCHTDRRKLHIRNTRSYESYMYYSGSYNQQLGRYVFSALSVHNVKYINVPTIIIPYLWSLLQFDIHTDKKLNSNSKNFLVVEIEVPSQPLGSTRRIEDSWCYGDE